MFILALMVAIQLSPIQTSCDVFETILNPESEPTIVEQDISIQTVKDYGWGVWTKYKLNLATIEQLGMKEYNMHVLSEVQDDQTILMYYIAIDKINQQFSHKLYLMQDEILQIRELVISQSLIGDQWVYFYYCYSEENKYYNIFLYFRNEVDYVQMSQGGPQILQNSQIKQYQLGGSMYLINQFDKNFNQYLYPFTGEISKMDLRSALAYENIEIFLANLDKVECEIDICISKFQQQLIESIVFDGIPIQRFKLQYIKSKFNIYGWVKVDVFEKMETIESVLMRATLRNKYYEDKILGDKAFYWKYIQSNQLPDLNGLTFTTYHFDSSQQNNEYQTLLDDSMQLNGDKYSTMITQWHWFIYSESVTGKYNTQLYIYFGQTNSEIFLEVNKVHYDKSKLYLNIGGDAFNSNFRGIVRNLTYNYCYTNDYQPKRICDISCKTCFGPYKNHCLECSNSETSHRILIDGICTCKRGYIDIGEEICQPRQIVLKNINIQEEILANNEDCQFGQFIIQNNGTKYCLECPSRSAESSLTCVDCLINPTTWYLNPFCTTDYLQISLDDPEIVFEKQIRLPINYEYYLINYEESQYSINLCIGCLQKDNQAIEFINRKTLNIISKIMCKTCYLVINDECVYINENCLNCDNNGQCQECEKNFTIYNGKCFSCPQHCPNCKKNNTNLYCQDCISGYYFNKTSEECQQCGQYCAICMPASYNEYEMQCIKCIDQISYFISADRQNCRQNTIQNCDYQGQEYTITPFNTNFSYLDVVFSSTMDIYTFSPTTQPAYDVCYLCKDKFVNKMFLYMSDGSACLSPNDLPNIPQELKEKVLNSENYSYQLAYFQDMFRNPESQSFKLIYGTNVKIQQKNSNQQIVTINYESSVIIKQSIDEIICNDIHCAECLKNYIWTQSFCIKCETGYYANIRTGNCYLCPQQCEECQEQHMIFKDGWKWKLRVYQHFRNLQFYGFHNFNTFNADEDINQYRPYCTKCKNNQILNDGKCYKSCNCPTCILKEEKMTCLKCSNGIQNVIDGNCVTCPKYCSLCQYLNNEEIKKINPYFNPMNNELYNYARQCIKSSNIKPEVGILYHDISIGFDINCQQSSKCYKYVELQFNIYCSLDPFNKDQQDLQDEEQSDFLSKNMLLSQVFSKDSQSHFSQIENIPLYNDLNENGVKLLRIILNIKEDTGNCIINANTFISSNFRNNIFTLKYLELRIESQLNIPIKIENNITFYEFTSVSFKNILFQNIESQTIINLMNIYEVDLNIDTLKIVNSSNLQLQFKIQNPNQIKLENIEISNSIIQNLNGLIFYYFTIDPQRQLNYEIKSIKITNSQIINSQLFVQIISEKQKQQIFEVENFESNENNYQNSIIFFTKFSNTQRSSSIIIQQLISNKDILTNSSYCLLHGALSVVLNNTKISNCQFKKQTKLFKLPLFIMNDLILYNNNFTSPDNCAITNNIDVLYSDNFQENLIKMNHLYFQKNQYVRGQTFIELIQNKNFLNLQVQITYLNMELNKFNQLTQQSLFLNVNATLYFNVKQFILKNCQIIRATGLSEISINNADQIEIHNLTAIQDKKYHIKLLHSQLNCLGQLQELAFGGILYIFNSKLIQLNQIVLEQLQIINQPLISIRSIERLQIRQQEIINIFNSKFSYNTLIITRLQEQQSVLSIISEQEQQITMNKIFASNNFQHCYIEDLLVKQSSTFVLQNPYSSIVLDMSQFQSNYVSNSQNSNLILIGKNVKILNTVFENSNYFKYSRIKNEIIWSYEKQDEIFVENLQRIFLIKSKGGSAYLQADQLYFSNSTFINSIGVQGGALYIVTQTNGIVYLNESKFFQNSASIIENQNSQGGSIFIDASQSILNLYIGENIFEQSQSRKEGGVIFIEPSRDYNSIKIVQSNFLDIYSFFNPLIRLPVTFASSSLYLNVEIINCSISNTFQGFINFLGLIQNITQSELSNQKQNYLMSFDRGNITLKNIQVQNIFTYGILQVQNVDSITINNLDLQNMTLKSQSMISIIPNKKFNFKSWFHQIRIREVREFSEFPQQFDKSLLELKQLSQKCENLLTLPNDLPYFFGIDYILSLQKKNYQLILSQNFAIENIISFTDIQKNSQIDFQFSSFQGISCPNCNSGLITIANINQSKNKKNIYMKDLVIINNFCGLSCIVFSSKKIDQIQLVQIGRRLLTELEDFQQKQEATIRLENSFFVNNTAKYGGAVLSSSIDMIINDCQFQNNTGLQAGGAVYIEYLKGYEVQIYNTLITNNKAQIGGGIYVGGQALNKPQRLKNQNLKNFATFYGNNLANIPNHLSIQINDQILNTQRITQNSTHIIDQVEIQQYEIGNISYKYLTLPSGQTVQDYQIFDESNKQFISWNQTFRIVALNEENDQIKYLNGTKCFIQSKHIIDEINEQINTNQRLSENEIQFNTSSQDYNLDSFIITFDSNNTGYLQLEINCDSIKIPQFQDSPPYSFKNYFTNYKIRINIKTFPCQKGEYQTDQGGCKLCDSKSDQYTILAGQRCQIKDQITMETVTPARIKLRPLYWRPFENSQKIEYCINMPINCVGGWEPGNALCSFAHTGALCEQCDIYNVRGDGSFSVSTQYVCGNCEDVGNNSAKIMLISLWTMISIFLSVKGTNETVKNMVAQQKLQKFRIFAMDPRVGYGSVLIKVLTNYLQIIGSISTFQLKLPSALQSSLRSVGNPIEAMSFSLDCFLKDISNIDIIYFRMIWALIMPVFYIIIFLLGYIIAILLGQTNFNKGSLTTTAIYLFTYLQPTLLGGFISLISYRYISNIAWIQGNVSYNYNSETHQNWILAFILPFILILGIVIPMYMFISLMLQKNTLETESTRKTWGYLYNEYQPKAYFWEIVKIYQKGLMIVFLTFYEDLIIIKAALIFIIVFIYQMLSKKFRPYKLPHLNFLDEIGAIICGTSIVLGIAIYQANNSDNQEIIWPSYISLIFMNLIFILFIIWEIILVQINDQQEILDKLRDKINKKYPQLASKSTILVRLLVNRKKQQIRIKRRFQRIRKYLMKIVKDNPKIYSLPPLMDSQLEEKQSNLLIYISKNESNKQQNSPDLPIKFDKHYPASLHLSFEEN